MHKRVISFLLSAAIILGLFCGAAPSVHAAGMTTSDECIAMIKHFEGFSKYPYYDNGQYTVGYGTACPESKLDEYRSNGISEKEAEALLTEHLESFEASLNSFANKYSLKWNQSQFDALLSFTYNCGAGWMSSSNSATIRSAIVDSKTGNDFIFAMGQWSTASGKVLPSLVERRLIECNMYLNGVYSTKVPSNYKYVLFDNNLDSAECKIRVQAFDAELGDDIRATPTASGYTFTGWYTKASGGTKVKYLDENVSVTTLYAHWNTGEGNYSDTEEPDEEETVIATGTVTASSSLNIRSGAGTSYSKVGSLSAGARVEIYETKVVDGTTWGRISSGWISLDYVKLDAQDEEPEENEKPEEDEEPAEDDSVIFTGTVTASSLKVRSGAGTGHSAVSSVYAGATVEIYEIVTVDGTAWGRISNGWISLDYVESDMEAPVLKATNVASSGKIKLSWTAVKGAASYKVYRATSKTGDYKLLKTMRGTNLTNTSTTAGTKYYYYVVAVTANGIRSKSSDIVSRTCDLPRPSFSIGNVASSGKIRLTWEAVEGAAKYEVYRCASKNGTYTKMYTTSGTSYTNTGAAAGATYYYKIKAIAANSAANSAFSSVKARTCDLPRPVVTAGNVASSGKIRLTWEAVEGAVKYEIYRSSSANGTYTKIYTATGTKFTNTSVKAGETYYYKVKAIAEQSVANSALSSAVGSTCDLSRPTVSVKLNSSGKPVLTWEAVDGAVQYKVYRATSKNGTYSLLKTVSGTKLTNTSAKAGVTYYYKVVAVASDTEANSAKSAVVSITSN